MSLNGTNPVNGEGLVPNPAFAGLVNSLQPSDIGLSANTLFPMLPFQSNGNGLGYFFKYNLAEGLAALPDEVLQRRPATSATKINRARRLETFRVRQRHLDAIVSDQMADLIRAQTNGQDDPNVTEVINVREKMLLGKELRAANAAKNDAAVGYHTTPATPWDLYTDAGSDPIGNIQELQLRVRSNAGAEANAMAIPYEVALKLAYHPKLRIVRANTERQGLSMESLVELLKSLLGFDTINILKALYNTQGVRRDNAMSLANVWGQSVWVYHQPREIGWNQVMWGIDAADTFYYGAMGDGAGVFTFRQDDIESTVHRVREDSDVLILNPELAARLDNVLD